MDKPNCSVETYGKDKRPETVKSQGKKVQESQLGAVWGAGRGGVTVKGTTKMVLRGATGAAAQFGKCTEDYWIVHLVQVKFVLCKSYSNKAIL